MEFLEKHRPDQIGCRDRFHHPPGSHDFLDHPITELQGMFDDEQLFLGNAVVDLDLLFLDELDDIFFGIKSGVNRKGLNPIHEVSDADQNRLSVLK